MGRPRLALTQLPRHLSLTSPRRIPPPCFENGPLLSHQMGILRRRSNKSLSLPNFRRTPPLPNMSPLDVQEVFPPSTPSRGTFFHEYSTLSSLYRRLYALLRDGKEPVAWLNEELSHPLRSALVRQKSHGLVRSTGPVGMSNRTCLLYFFSIFSSGLDPYYQHLSPENPKVHTSMAAGG